MTTYVPLTKKDAASIRFNFERVVVPVLTDEHANEDGRAGAVLDVRFFNKPLVFMRAGKAPEEKFLSYEENAKAKNDALENNPDILVSWEVHLGDVSQKPYPGAIRTLHDDRFSISGFTWQRDTIGALYLANKAGRISIADAASFAEICGIRTEFMGLMVKFNAARKKIDLAVAV